MTQKGRMEEVTHDTKGRMEEVTHDTKGQIHKREFGNR